MLAGAISAAAVIIGGIYKIYRVAQRIDSALGVDKKGRTVAERMDKVEHQLWPNGGDSMADQLIENSKQISAVDKNVTALAAEMRVVRDLLTHMVEARVR